ncbi:MAG TPA: hypothetical protein VG387_03420 [Rhizomicrobium sp.]|jgi:hypothetical protein|nr:hypothetical protein [Rhizomicrobium sp.]
MDSNPFFRLLGRINTVLIALIGLTVLVILVVSQAWWLPREIVRRHDDGPVPVSDVTYQLDALHEDNQDGDVAVPDGWRDGLMLLNREDGARNPYALGSSGGGASPVGVNILSIDLETAKARYLFAGTARAIEAVHFVHGPKTQGVPQGPVTALLLTMTDADTNHDGKIDTHDDDALYLYRPGDAAPRRLLTARTVTGVRQVDDGRVLVSTADRAGDHVTLFATGDFHVLASGPLPAVSP